MQSINEELQTVNAELQSKNDALTRLNSDLKNLMDSTDIATVFLDKICASKTSRPPLRNLSSARRRPRPTAQPYRQPIDRQWT